MTPDPAAVPDGWQVVRLGDVAEVVGGTTPSRANEHYWGGEIPWVVPSELTALRGRYLDASREFITRQGLETSSLRVLPAGSVLLTSRATIGATAINTLPVTTNQGFQNLVGVSGVDRLWLYYCVSAMRHELEKRSAGSTFREVSRDAVRSLPILLPPLAEQRAIAAVLDSIDEAIERTEEVIAATERLRDALLHELLTRGLPGRHSEWADVPGLGTVPACWDVVRLGDVCDVTSGFAMGPRRAPRDHPRPYLTVANVHTDQVTVDEVRYMELTDAEHASRSLRAGDVVMVEGHAQVSQLGRAAIVPPSAEGFTFQNHLFRVRLLGDGDLGFVSAFINGLRGRAYFASFGGTTSGLNTVSAGERPAPSRSMAERLGAAGHRRRPRWRRRHDRAGARGAGAATLVAGVGGGRAADGARAGGPLVRLGGSTLEALDIDGLFWLEDAPNQQVAGRLTFGGADGARLGLIGAFTPLDQFGELGGPQRIHGVAGKRLLTLESCLQIDKTIEMPGILRESYHASRVLSGANLRESQSGGFTSVSLGLQHLQHWVSRTGTKVDTELSEDKNSFSRVTVTHEPLEEIVVQMEQETLELGFPSKMTLGVFEARITQDCSLTVRFDKPVHLQEALVRCTALQDLVTIGLDGPTVITRVSLSHEDLVRERSDGKHVHDPIQLYAQFQGGHLPQDGDGKYPANMLLSFDDIGGLDGVAGWLKTAERFSPVVGLLLDHWYLPEMHPETRFLNAVIAAEALERIRTRRQEFPFKEGLLSIAADTGEIAGTLVGDLDSWADEVRNMRVIGVVHRGLGEDIDYERMHYLSESIYMLVVVRLLQECGVGVTTLAGIQDHQRFQWVAERLRATA